MFPNPYSNPFSSLDNYNALRRAVGLDGGEAPSPDSPSSRSRTPSVSPVASPVRSTSSDEEPSDGASTGYYADLQRPPSPPRYSHYPNTDSYLPYSAGDASDGHAAYRQFQGYDYPQYPPAPLPYYHPNASIGFYHHPFYVPGQSSTSPILGPTLTLDRGEGYSESGCMVAAIATITGVDYSRVRRIAQRLFDFDGSEGLEFFKAQGILAELGKDSTLVDAEEWSDISDLAIVTVQGRLSQYHAVVFERNEHGEFIYDWCNHTPVRRRDDEYPITESSHLRID